MVFGGHPVGGSPCIIRQMMEDEMIVGTHFGLFMPALRPNWKECVENGEPELQVRSRRRVDLLNLKKFMEGLGLELGEPFAIKNTDYQWRAYCTRGTWGQALAVIANDIDYTKFKDTPEKYHGDRKLTDAYGKIWNATLNAFPTGSVYSQPFRPARSYARPVDETVVRRGGKDWVMAGSDPQQLAALMREIDAATADVDIPSDEEVAELDAVLDEAEHWADAWSARGGPTEVNGSLDHSSCTHGNSSTARRKCRKRFYGRI